MTFREQLTDAEELENGEYLEQRSILAAIIQEITVPYDITTGLVSFVVEDYYGNEVLCVDASGLTEDEAEVGNTININGFLTAVNYVPRFDNTATYKKGNNWICSTSSIGLERSKQNADIIKTLLLRAGWTINAISGILGNMTAESNINPGRWEGGETGNLGVGFGLVQWTPASKYINWVKDTYGTEDYANGDYQVARILWELENGVQFYPTPKYRLTFEEFVNSELPPGYLGATFLMNYERPKNQTPPNQRKRGENAEFWWRYITGDTEKETPISIYPFGTAHRRRKISRRSNISRR